jgi:hypothetical protein
MQAAAKGADALRSDPFGGQATGARRAQAWLRARIDDELAPEIAFLAAQECAPEALRLAEAAARRAGVSAEQALLGEGLIGEEAYYRALARHLRLPFYRGEIPVARSVEADPAIACGVAPLASNRAGLRVIAAPRAMAIRYLLDRAQAGALPPGLSIASPRMLNDRVRAQAGARVAAAAAGALAQRDPTLCARFGVSHGQCLAFAMVAIVAMATNSVAPDGLAVVLSAALWSLFAAAIVLRNLAVAAADAASPAPPLDDAELPIYTIIAPLRGEARMVAKLTRRLDALDYPVLGSKLT